MGMAAISTTASSRLILTTKKTAIANIRGERSRSRIDIRTMCCIREISLVNRVTSEAELNLSISKKDSCCILSKSLVRKSVPKPIPMREDTYTLMILTNNPANEIKIIKVPTRVITERSRGITPLSIISAINIG